jgi:hypothetical protein
MKMDLTSGLDHVGSANLSDLKDANMKAFAFL